MARPDSTPFAPSWYSVFESPGLHAHEQRTRAFVRLWRAFMRARVLVAVVVLALQLFLLLHGGGTVWLTGLSSAYLLATVAVMLWWTPSEHGRAPTLQWLITLGIDLATVALLQFFQVGSINFTPLFALPVLMAAILGPLVLGLGTAAGVTLLLLAEAWLSSPQLGQLDAARLLAAGLAGTGFFVVAALAHQLASRLAREEAVSAISQAAARAQAAVNEVIIESLALGVLVADAHGVVRHANPAARTMLMGENFPAGARLLLSARPAWSHLAALVEESFAVGAALETETTIAHAERPGQRLRARTQLTPAVGERGSLCVLFLEDLREVEARVRTEKLASMGRMSAAVAHEIRNPLSAITQANALLDEELRDATHKRLTQMIRQNAQRLSRIVDDILNIARPQPSRLDELPVTPLSLDAMVRQVCAEWMRQNQVGQALGVHLHAGQGLVGFDAEHLRRLLVNLLDNALRHASGQAASIRLITQPSRGQLLRLSVWSDGGPLEASVLKHLFEPFFSSESRSSGLGLFICRELCERYGAQIAYQRARLDQREGNEFYVLMPQLRASGERATDAAARPREAAQPEPLRSTGSPPLAAS